MKIMTIVAAAALLCGTTFAQGVPDGSDWTDDEGTSVTVDVVDNNPATPGCTVQMTAASGSTSAVTGTASADSTTEKPKAESAPASSTAGGEEYRITKKANGKSVVQVKKNGKWINMRQTKRKKGGAQRPARLQPLYFGPGQDGASLPPESL
jgi:hypothetical protein